jgi:hypothetical protein
MTNPNHRRVGNRLERVAKAIFSASSRQSVPRLLVVSLAVTVVLFVLDLRTSADIAVPFLYVLPVACVIFWTSPHQFIPVIVAAIISTVLNILGFFWSEHIINTEITTVNRLIATCVTWGIVILSMLRKGDEKDNTPALERERLNRETLDSSHEAFEKEDADGSNRHIFILGDVAWRRDQPM